MSWRVTRRGRGWQALSRTSISSLARSRAGSGAGFSGFFSQAIVGEHLSDQSGADLEALFGKRLGDLISREIGLEACADDTFLNLLGAF
jgi:hypothetical protein